MYELNAAKIPASNPAVAKTNLKLTDSAKGYPRIVAVSETNNEFVASAKTTVSYRLNPKNAKADNYTYSFVNRTVETYSTRAADDKADLLNVDSYKVAGNGFLDVTLSLKKELNPEKPSFYNENGKKANNLVALKAVGKGIAEDEIVSDYSYIERDVNWEYYIVHKDKFDKAKPKYYRWAAAPKMTDPTDFNGGAGIETPAPGPAVATDPKNPASIQLVYDQEVDLADYVETYAKQLKDKVSVKGINPTYEYFFAGFGDKVGAEQNDDELVIGTSGAAVKYLAEAVGGEKTNQNEFVKLEGSVLSVDDQFVSNLSPAIGRTPLIYVRSKVVADGKTHYLAEAFIKIEIVKEEEEIEDETKPWKVFVVHDVNFEFDELPANHGYTSTGKTGEGKAWDITKSTATVYGTPNLSNKLLVTWTEMNQWVLNQLNISMDEFKEKYYYEPNDVKIILTKKKDTDPDTKAIEPGKTCPAYGDKKTVLKPLGELVNYYKKEGGAACVKSTAYSATTWTTQTNVLDLQINDNAKVGDPNYVYVLYPAKNPAKDIPVVIEFIYTIAHHQHNFEIVPGPEGNPMGWILNPDYLLGSKNTLNETEPFTRANAYKDTKKYPAPLASYITANSFKYYGFNEGSLDDPAYTTFGGVRINGQDSQKKTGIIEHFKEYGKKTGDTWYMKVNDDAEYTFRILNFASADVKFTATNAGTVTATATDNCVVLTAAELKAVQQQEKTTPYIEVVNNALLANGLDVLVQVIEECKSGDSAGVKVGYYYVVFEALKMQLNLNDVELGTFPDVNDYALASELVAGILDANGDTLFVYGFDAQNDVYRWLPYQAKNGDVAAQKYGLVDATLSVKVTKIDFTKHGEQDNEPSFGGGLTKFAAGAELAPAGGVVAEDGINWRNLGTDLQYRKYADYEVKITYTLPGDNAIYDLCSNTATVIILPPAESTYPRHIWYANGGVQGGGFWALNAKLWGKDFPGAYEGTNTKPEEKQQGGDQGPDQGSGEVLI